MKVWVVSSGCKYEGGSVKAVVDSKEKAIEFMNNMAAKENAEGWRNKTQDGAFISDLSGTAWYSGTDYIEAEEWEVN